MELESVIQEIRVARGLRKGVKRLKEMTVRKKRQRLKKAFYAMRDLVKGTLRRSRKRIEIGLERALARFLLTVCLNRWKESVMNKKTQQALSFESPVPQLSSVSSSTASPEVNSSSATISQVLPSLPSTPAPLSPVTRPTQAAQAPGGGETTKKMYLKTWKNFVRQAKRTRLEMMWKAKAAAGGGDEGANTL